MGVGGKDGGVEVECVVEDLAAREVYTWVGWWRKVEASLLIGTTGLGGVHSVKLKRGSSRRSGGRNAVIVMPICEGDVHLIYWLKKGEGCWVGA